MSVGSGRAAPAIGLVPGCDAWATHRTADADPPICSVQSALSHHRSSLGSLSTARRRRISGRNLRSVCSLRTRPRALRWVSRSRFFERIWYRLRYVLKAKMCPAIGDSPQTNNLEGRQRSTRSPPESSEASVYIPSPPSQWSLVLSPSAGVTALGAFLWLFCDYSFDRSRFRAIGDGFDTGKLVHSRVFLIAGRLPHNLCPLLLVPAVVSGEPNSAVYAAECWILDCCWIGKNPPDSFRYSRPESYWRYWEDYPSQQWLPPRKKLRKLFYLYIFPYKSLK